MYTQWVPYGCERMSNHSHLASLGPYIGTHQSRVFNSDCEVSELLLSHNCFVTEEKREVMLAIKAE